MKRTIDGFLQDEQGDWVAQLSCLHGQHIRHQPPFRERRWVQSESGRRARVGSAIECPLCDRAELPDGLHVARTAGPFDGSTVPVSLQRGHCVAERTWGCLRVIDGCVGFSMVTAVPVDRCVNAGDRQAIPPGVPHALRLDRPFRLEIDFLVRTR